MYLVINKCVTAVKVSNFSGHYLRNRSTLDIGVFGYIGMVQHKEHSPEVLSIPPGTPCVYIYINSIPNTWAWSKLHCFWRPQAVHNAMYSLHLQQLTVDPALMHAYTAVGHSDETRSNAPNVCHYEHHNHPNRPVHFRQSQAYSRITPYTWPQPLLPDPSQFTVPNNYTTTDGSLRT